MIASENFPSLTLNGQLQIIHKFSLLEIKIQFIQYDDSHGLLQ